MIDDRLTSDIERGAKARPMYKTDIVELDGGLEVVDSRWVYPLHEFEFNLAPGNPQDNADFAQIRDLFYAAGGRAETWKFRHWRDYQGADEALLQVDDYGFIFQLMRNYTRGAVTRQRKITRPVQDTVVIFINGIETGSNWVCDYTTGQVTFDSPQVGSEITADFDFDVPVRFKDDEIEFVGLTEHLDQPVSIVIREVKELDD